VINESMMRFAADRLGGVLSARLKDRRGTCVLKFSSGIIGDLGLLGLGLLTPEATG
jgi:hypothetical protein